MGIPRTAAPCRCQSMRSSCCGSPSCPACLHIPSASPDASAVCSRPFCSQISVEARIQISVEQSKVTRPSGYCAAQVLHVRVCQRLLWHGHEGCKYFRMPKTNTDFWEKKIKRNKERDKEEQRQLAKMGWHCITVWECELKQDKREKTLASLAFTLNHIYLQDRSFAYPRIEEESDLEQAAEPKPNS